MSEDSAVINQIHNNKNKQNIKCQFCNSLILKDQQGVYEKTRFNLPSMHQKNSKHAQAIETEFLNDFLMVDDMFTFENIGFSNTVDDRKYLVCADCDMGPVGYHDMTTKKSYIAVKRVNHGNAPIKAVST